MHTGLKGKVVAYLNSAQAGVCKFRCTSPPPQSGCLAPSRNFNLCPAHRMRRVVLFGASLWRIVSHSNAALRPAEPLAPPSDSSRIAMLVDTVTQQVWAALPTH
jgi:hypothetical protein